MPCFFHFECFVVGSICKAIRSLVAGAREYKTACIIMRRRIFKREEIDVDAVISTMKILSVLMDRVANNVDHMVNEAERVKAPDRNQ